jgi:hypothetical protein
LALGSCAASTPLVVTAGPSVRAPDALTRPCEGAQSLPQRGLTAGEVVALWGRDRVSLAACRRRHGALAAHVRAQELVAGADVHAPFILGERGLSP